MIEEPAMSANKEMKRYLSLRYKLLIPLMGLGVLMFIMGYFGAREYLRNTIYKIMDEEVKSITDFVTNCMDEDQLEALTTEVKGDFSVGWPESMTDTRYWDQQECLVQVDEFNPRTELYTYYAVDEKTLANGLDQYATLFPEDSYVFAETFTAADEEDMEYLLKGLTETTRYPDLEYDEEAQIYYYAVVTPLRNSKNEIIGGLAVYLDAGSVVESLQILSKYLIAIFGGLFIVVTLLVLGITRSVTSELITLQATSKRVAEGDYTAITLRPHKVNDEVSTLGELFNTMLDKVREREEDLQIQVEELKLQIDHEKRSTDVKEIVDSQFFKDLKQRAAEVRKQRQQKE
jgi:methyl-accepting chemotaxis protein